MVESQPSKLLVAGSIPVSRSRDSRRFAGVSEAGVRSRNPERLLRGILRIAKWALSRRRLKLRKKKNTRN